MSEYTQVQKIYGAGGEGGSFTNPNPTPTTIGGISAGSTFNNVPLVELWSRLLYPYQSPSFVSFTIQGVGTLFEVGNTLPANSVFLWSTSHNENILPNTIGIRDVTNAVDLVVGTANDGIETTTHDAIIKTSAVSHTFRISGTNTNSVIFSRNGTYSWRWRMYYGESATSPLTEADCKGLRANLLTNTFARTYDFLAGGYKYIVYPSNFGTASNFTDANTMLSVPFQSPYIVSITNSFGQTTDYNVHRTTNVLGGSISIIVS